MPLVGENGNDYPVSQGIRIVFDLEWNVAVQDFPATIAALQASAGKITKVSPLSNGLSYRVEIDLPAGQRETTLTVPAGIVKSTIGGATNASPAEARSSVDGAAEITIGGAEGSPGGGFGGVGDAGGSAGEAGNPGDTPAAFSVTPGYDAAGSPSTLRLSWSRHANRIVFYQVIRNTAALSDPAADASADVVATNPAPSTPVGNPDPAILNPFGKPIPAVKNSYRVSLPVAAKGSKPVYYRIRACNTVIESSNEPTVGGFTGCTDSKEFVAGFIGDNIAPGALTRFCPTTLFAQNGNPGNPAYPDACN